MRSEDDYLTSSTKFNWFCMAVLYGTFQNSKSLTLISRK